MLFTMMIVMMLRQAAPFLFAVEHHKVLAERVERGNEHAGEDGEIAKPLPGRVLYFAASIIESLE